MFKLTVHVENGPGIWRDSETNRIGHGVSDFDVSFNTFKSGREDYPYEWERDQSN